MRHARHYTLEEARAALPWVVERLAGDAARPRGADRPRDAPPAARGRRTATAVGARGRRSARRSSSSRPASTDFEEREIVLRDLDRGLIDFPALRDGREVYLCWIDGETDIGFWHELDAGFAGREAL